MRLPGDWEEPLACRGEPPRGERSNLCMLDSSKFDGSIRCLGRYFKGKLLSTADWDLNGEIFDGLWNLAWILLKMSFVLASGGDIRFIRDRRFRSATLRSRISALSLPESGREEANATFERSGDMFNMRWSPFTRPNFGAFKFRVVLKTVSDRQCNVQYIRLDSEVGNAAKLLLVVR